MNFSNDSKESLKSKHKQWLWERNGSLRVTAIRLKERIVYYDKMSNYIQILTLGELIVTCEVSISKCVWNSEYSCLDCMVIWAKEVSIFTLKEFCCRIWSVSAQRNDL